MPHADLYPLTASGLAAKSGFESWIRSDLASVFTHDCGLGTKKYNGKLPMRLPQFDIQRIGIRRIRFLGE